MGQVLNDVYEIVKLWRRNCRYSAGREILCLCRIWETASPPRSPWEMGNVRKHNLEILHLTMEPSIPGAPGSYERFVGMSDVSAWER